jgi:hypothetical protein
MIKLFRKIRQNMIRENKASKYLLYAIGEIILVVIGILIALSINNWNENRRVQQQEIQICKEIRSDLTQTKKDILDIITSQKEMITSTQSLFNDIKNKMPYSRTIYGKFAQAGTDFQIIPKTSGFENLKNIGLNTLSNDSLRIAITNLFQLSIIPLKNELKNVDSGFNVGNSLFPYQEKYFEIDYNRLDTISFKHADTLRIYELKIKEYENFIKDADFLRTLQLALYTRSRNIDGEMKTVQEIDTVLERINKELKKISN